MSEFPGMVRALARVRVPGLVRRRARVGMCLVVGGERQIRRGRGGGEILRGEGRIRRGRAGRSGNGHTLVHTPARRLWIFRGMYVPNYWFSESRTFLGQTSTSRFRSRNVLHRLAARPKILFFKVFVLPNGTWKT